MENYTVSACISSASNDIQAEIFIGVVVYCLSNSRVLLYGTFVDFLCAGFFRTEKPENEPFVR